LPIADSRSDARFHRLMVAQDTGSAIVGPARADIYWGAGDAARRIAGRIRQQGRFPILLPRELDMVAAGRAMPLPRPKPPILHEIVAKKREGDQARGHTKDGAKPQGEKARVAGALISNAQSVGDHRKSLIKLRPQTPPNSKRGQISRRGTHAAESDPRPVAQLFIDCTREVTKSMAAGCKPPRNVGQPRVFCGSRLGKTESEKRRPVSTGIGDSGADGAFRPSGPNAVVSAHRM